jgi:fumarate hydratase class II
MTIREATLDLGFVADGRLTEAQLDQALDLSSMTGQSSTGRSSSLRSDG